MTVASTADSDSRIEIARVGQGSLAAVLGMVTFAAFGYIFVAIVTHKLPAREAGALFQAVAIISVVTTLATLGADTGLVRTMPSYKTRGYQNIRNLFAVALVPSLAVGVIASVVVFLAAHTLAHHMIPNPSLRVPTARELRLLSPTVSLVALTTILLAGTRGWTLRPTLFVQYFLVPVLRPLLLAGFAIFTLTTVEAAISWGVPLLGGLVVAAVLAVNLMVRVKRQATGTEVPVAIPSVAGQFWRFSLPRSAESVLLVFLNGMDVILVGALSTSAAAALYTTANRLALLSLFTLQAVLLVIQPRLSELIHRRSDREVRDVYRTASWWVLAASWPPLLLLSLFAAPLMGTFGHAYRAGATALVVLSLGQLVSAATGPSGALILMSGKSWVNLTISVVCVGLNIVMMFAIVKHLGATGGALAYTGAIVLANVLQTVVIWRTFGAHPFGKEFLTVAGGAVLSFVGVGLLIRSTLGNSLVAVLLTAVVGGVLYAVLIHRIRRWLHLSTALSLMSATLLGSGGRWRHRGGRVTPLDSPGKATEEKKS